MRPIAINNCLVHGICNYNCITCHVNKANYNGPKEYQSIETVRLLIKRIKEAAGEGIYVRYLALSGDGEPALHPQFKEIIDLFGHMLAEWQIKKIRAPKIAVVTNGYNLDKHKVTGLIKNKIGIKISFPSSIKAHYDQITRPVERPALAYDQVVDNINGLIKEAAKKYFDDIEIHVSPPVADLLRNDFNQTVDYLTKLYQQYGKQEIKLVMFPAISNRSGQVKGIGKNVDFYKDLFKKYNGKKINNVKITMTYSVKKFYRNFLELVDVYRTFRYPCLWNANFMISASGLSVCVNDQSLRYSNGDIKKQSIRDLISLKETFEGCLICKGCNQNPGRMNNNLILKILRRLFRFS